MSAWIVETAHVAAMVKFAMRDLVSGINCENAEQVAGLLYAQNVRSVNHRYPDHTPEEPLAFTLRMIERAPVLTPVECVKACQCLDYQSCETDDYRETEARKWIARIESAAICRLPGYDDAPWGIERGHKPGAKRVGR